MNIFKLYLDQTTNWCYSLKELCGVSCFITSVVLFKLEESYNDDQSSATSEHFSGGFSFLANITDGEEPKTFKTASTKPEWQLAMQEEFDALKTQGTWLLVPPPSNRSVIGSKWVYKVKKDPDGTVSRYKARLVA